MIIHKAFLFKLQPTPAQAQQFVRYVGTCRWVWNCFLAERQHHYRTTGQAPSMYEQQRALPLLK